MTAAPQRVTMAAIAAAAEVSVPTVSKVLNGRARRRGRDAGPGGIGARRVRLRPQPAPQDPARPPHRPGVHRAQPVGRPRSSAAPARPRSRPSAGSPSPWSADDADVDHWLRSLTASRTDGVILVLTELSAAAPPAGWPRCRSRWSSWTRSASPTPRCCPSARPTGPAAWPRPSTCSASGTGGSARSPAARPSCAARPGWTATAPRWSARASPSTRSSSGPATSTTSRRSPPRSELLRAARPADGDLRGQRRAGDGRVRGGAAARPAAARGPERGRLRRRPDGAVGLAAADHAAPAAGRDGHPGHQDPAGRRVRPASRTGWSWRPRWSSGPAPRRRSRASRATTPRARHERGSPALLSQPSCAGRAGRGAEGGEDLPGRVVAAD